MKMTQHENFSQTSKSVFCIFILPPSSSLLLAFCLPSSQASLSVGAAAAPSSSSATSAANRLAPRFLQDLVALLFSRQSDNTLKRR